MIFKGDEIMSLFGIVIGGPVTLAGFYFLAVEGFSGTSVGLVASGFFLLAVDIYETKIKGKDKRR